MDADWLSVADVASRLGVHGRQVRRLIDDGQLPARKVPGGAWVVDPQAVAVRVAARPGPGQPLSPSNAWRFMELALQVGRDRSFDGEAWRALGAAGALDGVTREQRRRLLLLLASGDPAQLTRVLRRRGRLVRVSAHRSLLDAIGAEQRVWVGGAHAVAALGGGIAGGGRLRVYVREADRIQVAAQYRLRPDPEGEADLMVISAAVEPARLPQPSRYVPLSVAWFDCLDDSDSRARHAAAQWVQHLARKPAASGALR